MDSERATSAAPSPALTTARKALVVGLGRIGDLILTTPIYEALRAANPSLEIHALVGRNNAEVVRDDPRLARVHVYSKRLVDSLQMFLALRSERYDLWLDPKDHPSSESRLFARLSGASVTVGYNKPGRSGPFHYAIPDVDGNRGLHAVARSLRVIEPFGLTDLAPVLRVHVPAWADEAFERFKDQRGIDAYTFVNPSAYNGARHWPIANWIALLNAPRFAGTRFVVCGAPNDRVNVLELARGVEGAVAFETPSVVGSFPAIAGADLVVTVDTAVVHIASAFDVPLLGLYRSVKDHFYKYAPLSTIHRALTPNVDALPADLGRPSCVRDITVPEVLDGLESMLDAGGGELTARARPDASDAGANSGDRALERAAHPHQRGPRRPAARERERSANAAMGVDDAAP